MRTTALVVLLSVMAALPANGAAQETYTLPTYTDQQRWNRAGTLIFAVLVGDLAARKAAGMTPRQAGQASAQVFGPPNGWNTSNTPISLFRGMYRNWMTWQQMVVDQELMITIRTRPNR